MLYCSTGYRILVDSAYPCLRQLLTPYRDNGNLLPSHHRFNKTLSSQRVHIEHAFGIFKQRFRQMYFCKLQGSSLLCHFIRACMVLHNIVIDDPKNFETYLTNNQNDNNIELQRRDAEPLENGNVVRDEICADLLMPELPQDQNQQLQDD